MTAPEPLALQGCSPTPLASYLKALGVLRLLSSGVNNVAGKPADPHVRGWWEGEQFHLQTSLARDGLLRFFLHDYAPSPIIAPWNGGSGFYPKDNKDGFRPLASKEVARRFLPFSSAIRCGAEALRVLDLKASPKGVDKADLVAVLRGSLPDEALPWLDAALVLSGDRLRFPQLLGTGGNDGRLEFTNNLMRRLVSEKTPKGVFAASSGTPSPTCEGFLENALFGSPARDLTGVAVGQFAPGGAGGANATTGYEGSPTVNPWDYVFMLEGAATFASAATRRYQSNAMSRASFPFTVAPSAAGCGGLESTDESDARGEFWAPVWTRSARFSEVQALFAEGRAVTNGRTASDGLDFARALATLGVNRGFSEFQRFGFVKRAGKNHYAAALGRRRAAPSPGVQLAADLDQGAWLRQCRRFARNDRQPAAMRTAVKHLEDSLFSLLAPECSRSSVNAALVSVGCLGEWLSNSPEGRKAVGPPPLLSRAWVKRADDGSAEFRVAAALAGIGMDPSSGGNGSDPPPMAAHFAPLTNGPGAGFESKTFFKGNWPRRVREWPDSDAPPTVVWGHGGLVRNMIAVLERRIVETSIRGLTDKPLGSASWARLSDVSAFLSGDFDDARCSALLAGLVWARPTRLPSIGVAGIAARASLPFAYAAVKPIFSPNKDLARVGAIPQEGVLPIPPGLVSRLRAGGGSLNGRVVAGVVHTAFTRARSSGLASPYDAGESGSGVAARYSNRIGVGIRPDRLAAAMLIPISRRGLARLLHRAYPGATSDNANPPPEETSDGN